MDSSASTPASASLANNASGLRFMLRALAYRNYRLFFLGQGVSLIGTWITTIATSWLVLRLAQGSIVTKAATVLGVVRFAGQIPMFLLGPPAGVLVDRTDRHRVLVATQVLSMLQSAALAYLAFSGHITISHIVLLSIFQGAVNAFDAAARQAFVVEMVERREDLPNAIALNSSMFNGARLIGPAVAGLLIARFSEALCFLIDAISYLAVIISLLMMTVPRRKPRAHESHPLREMSEGFGYAFGFPPVRAILLLTAWISFTVAAYQTLMPLFADKLAPPGHGAAVFGFMGTAVGVGALAGAVYLASRRSVIGLGRAVAISSIVIGGAISVFAISTALWLTMAVAIVGGFVMIIVFAAGNTMLQTIVDDEMRGRLMSFFITAVMGASPLGSVAAGWLADRIGTERTVLFAGVASSAAGLLFLVKLPALRNMVRPIYVRKGIIPEVATGLTAATQLNTPGEQ
jgi:MFS family permease